MPIQRKLIIGLVLSGLLVSSVTGQIPESTPKDTVEQLWSVATRGDLLTVTGWARASSLFTRPTASPGNAAILVVSNIYGVKRVSVEGKSAKVQVECGKLGLLDSQLRFTREPPTDAYETDEEYHLVSSTKYPVAHGPDGKTQVWQIEGSPLWPPWTTVNTAIRYVLEQKVKATDPVVKKNADHTIEQLLALH
jgi:hypothetical protein